MGATSVEAAQYLIEELKYIRSRLEGLSSEVTRIEIFSLSGFVSFYGFMLFGDLESQHSASADGLFVLSRDYVFFLIGLFVFLFFVYGWVRYKLIMDAIVKHDDYIRDFIEPYFHSGTSRPGFVRYYGEYIAGKPLNHRLWRHVYWGGGASITLLNFLFQLCSIYGEA
ncbi:hypothetical protein [Rhizobium sp. AAP116]|jgi:hypothetical protein|uniref:hypothetical protein n=1 Tax=Rhizobium sp. AAP116 TaxID=1523429 RepID=UPI0006B9552D|nr:hypothetical protein [Rhizobium sp. AAP116]KPF60594.1 hypothetical protein IP85_04035 [Rhizobium sp. AAP116]